MNDSLPSCLCGSGKLYEECYYNVVLPDGGPEPVNKNETPWSRV